MPNDPKSAKEKRTDPGPRQNAQGDHEGSAHTPDKFDVMNPQMQDLTDLQSIPRQTGAKKNAALPKRPPATRP